MNELAFIQRNDIFTTTQIISSETGNEHESVVAMLKKYWADFEESGKIRFTDLKSGKRGRPTRVYQLNEAQALLLITYLDNTTEVRHFKKELVQQFIAMRTLLLERKTQDWQAARLESKDFRRMLTDTIQELIPYAVAQGSQNADKLYMSYSKLIKQLGGYDDLDLTDRETLSTVTMMLRIVRGVMVQEMAVSAYYKDIYQWAKVQLMTVMALWSAPRLIA